MLKLLALTILFLLSACGSINVGRSFTCGNMSHASSIGAYEQGVPQPTPQPPMNSTGTYEADTVIDVNPLTMSGRYASKIRATCTTTK